MPFSSSRPDSCLAWLRPVLAWTPLFLWTLLLGCTASNHPTRPSELGARVDPIEIPVIERSLATPGPIRFTRVVAADWEIARSGLINLDHPRAREAGLEDGPESIEIFFYVLEHPEFGDFLVDSGVASSFRVEGRNSDVSFLVEAAMNTESLLIHTATADWLAERSRPLAGVFLTHIHLDHVMGLPDVPLDTPVYVGPGETSASGFLNLFSRGTIDRMLGDAREVREWPFRLERGDEPIDVVDVFGDGSLWALHVPGHTPGSTAFLVRTTEGARLLVGDTSHTRWGWENDVEPGTFTADHVRNQASLAWLRALEQRHPEIDVHLGHQRLDRDARPRDHAGSPNRGVSNGP